MRYLLRSSLLFGMLAAAAVGAGPFGHYRTRPACRTGIPNRDYQFGAVAPQRRLVSQTAELLLAPSLTPGDATDDTLSIQVYQLPEERMELDHCSITRVAFQVRGDGVCVLSLLAEQNALERQTDVDPATSGKESALQVSHEKRNRFHVSVRAYGAYQVREDEAESTGATGKPLLQTFGPHSFWVERGVPKDVVLREKWPPRDLTLIQLIDRVEVTFAYEPPTYRVERVIEEDDDLPVDANP